MFAALAAGGQLRVGLEDTITFSRGRPVAEQRRAGGAGRDAG